jgi:hypothetical protein
MRLKKIFLKIILGFMTIVLIGQCTESKLTERKKRTTTLTLEETEISLHDWLSYYSWILENEGVVKANGVLPDSTAIEPEVWQYICNRSTKYSSDLYLPTEQPLGYFYSTCADFTTATKIFLESSLCPVLELPITGITYGQAIEFCKWRTNSVNKNPTKGLYKSVVTFRLPTEKEWHDLTKKFLTDNEINNGYYDSISDKYPKKRKNSTVICPNYNYKMIIPCESYTGKICVRAHYLTGKNALYDLFGNVSEMTSTKGIAKGGNYLTFANQCNIDSVQYYTKAETWLGFRCVIVKTE